MKVIKKLYLCGLFVLASCGSEKEPITFPPTVLTGNVSDIYREGATLHGSIQNQEDADIIEFGILYSNYLSMAEAIQIPSESGTLSSFGVSVNGLMPGNTYYYCAYATSGYSVVRGEVKTFNTTDANAPVFDDVHCETSTENTLQIAAHIKDIGDHELLLCGFCYKEAVGSEPTIADKTVYVEDLNVNYSHLINGLLPNKTYWVRAFAGNARGVGYSETIEVSTLVASVPVVSDVTLEAVTSNSTSVSASVWLPENEVISEAGFCWSAESKVPTIEHNRQAVEMTENNAFSHTFEDLKAATVYYIRPYVISTTHEGVYYGTVYKVETEAIVVPEVTPGGGTIENLPTEKL